MRFHNNKCNSCFGSFDCFDINYLNELIHHDLIYGNKLLEIIDISLDDLSTYIALIDKYTNELSINYECTAINMIEISEAFGAVINVEQRTYNKAANDLNENTDKFIIAIRKCLKGLDNCPSLIENFTDNSLNTDNNSESVLDSCCPPCGEVEIKAITNIMEAIGENKKAAKERLKEVLFKRHEEQISILENARIVTTLQSVNPLEQEQMTQWYRWKIDRSLKTIEEINIEIRNLDRMIRNYTRQEDEQRNKIIGILSKCIGA
jgi:CRISPR/Cas system CSM-associated protein Csm2 small subunit